MAAEALVLPVLRGARGVSGGMAAGIRAGSGRRGSARRRAIGAAREAHGEEVVGNRGLVGTSATIPPHNVSLRSEIQAELHGYRAAASSQYARLAAAAAGSTTLRVNRLTASDGDRATRNNQARGAGSGSGSGSQSATGAGPAAVRRRRPGSLAAHTMQRPEPIANDSSLQLALPVIPPSSGQDTPPSHRVLANPEQGDTDYESAHELRRDDSTLALTPSSRDARYTVGALVSDLDRDLVAEYGDDRHGVGDSNVEEVLRSEVHAAMDDLRRREEAMSRASRANGGDRNEEEMPPSHHLPSNTEHSDANYSEGRHAAANHTVDSHGLAYADPSPAPEFSVDPQRRVDFDEVESRIVGSTGTAFEDDYERADELRGDTSTLGLTPTLHSAPYIVEAMESAMDRDRAAEYGDDGQGVRDSDIGVMRSEVHAAMDDLRRREEAMTRASGADGGAGSEEDEDADEERNQAEMLHAHLLAQRRRMQLMETEWGAYGYTPRRLRGGEGASSEDREELAHLNIHQSAYDNVLENISMLQVDENEDYAVAVETSPVATARASQTLTGRGRTPPPVVPTMLASMPSPGADPSSTPPRRSSVRMLPRRREANNDWDEGEDEDAHLRQVAEHLMATSSMSLDRSEEASVDHDRYVRVGGSRSVTWEDSGYGDAGVVVNDGEDSAIMELSHAELGRNLARADREIRIAGRTTDSDFNDLADEAGPAPPRRLPNSVHGVRPFRGELRSGTSGSDAGGLAPSPDMLMRQFRRSGYGSTSQPPSRQAQGDRPRGEILPNSGSGAISPYYHQPTIEEDSDIQFGISYLQRPAPDVPDIGAGRENGTGAGSSSPQWFQRNDSPNFAALGASRVDPDFMMSISEDTKLLLQDKAYMASLLSSLPGVYPDDSRLVNTIAALRWETGL